MTIESRLARLERSNRIWRLAALATLGALTAILATGANGPTYHDEIVAKTLRIIGDDGHATITMTNNEDGSPLVVVGRPTETPYLLLKADPSASSIAMSPDGRQNSIRIQTANDLSYLRLGRDGDSAIQLFQDSTHSWARLTRQGEDAGYTLTADDSGRDGLWACDGAQMIPIPR